MITVYHANRSITRDSLCFGLGQIFTADDVRKNIKLGNYDKVAEVDTFDLDVAYRLTNHIHESWTENEGVTAIAEKVRSTSIGDILEVDGKRYVVDRVGFAELTDEPLDVEEIVIEDVS